MNDLLLFFMENWETGLGIAAIVTELGLRLIPSEKNRSILSLAVKIITAIIRVIPNRKKDGGKHALVISFVLLSLSSFAQNNSTFKTAYSYNADSTTVRTNVGAMYNIGLDLGALYYNNQSNKWRVFENGLWKDLLGGGGGGSTYTFDNALTTVGNNITWGGSLIQHTSISGDSYNFLFNGTLNTTLSTENDLTISTTVDDVIVSSADAITMSAVSDIGMSSGNDISVSSTGSIDITSINEDVGIDASVNINMNAEYIQGYATVNNTIIADNLIDLQSGGVIAVSAIDDISVTFSGNKTENGNDYYYYGDDFRFGTFSTNPIGFFELYSDHGLFYSVRDSATLATSSYSLAGSNHTFNSSGPFQFGSLAAYQSANDYRMRISDVTTATNTVKDSYQYYISSSGTPSAGFGGSFTYSLESGNNTMQQALKNTIILTDVTASSEDGAFTEEIILNGALTPIRSVTTSSGLAQTISGNVSIPNLQTADNTYSPSWTGFSSAPTTVAHYTKVGKLVTVWITITADGTSNANDCTVSLPSTSAVPSFGYASVTNNGSLFTGRYSTAIGSNVVTLYPSATLGATGWNTAGAKSAQFTLTYLEQ